MSIEEDTELRDLVSKTLENNGVLAKIRAELRASVFLALEEQEANSAPFENKALKEYLKSPQGALGLCIVREFLEYLELDFTLSVYNTETSHGKGYEYCGRNKLIKDLQMKSLNGKKGPLLSHILQIAQECSGVDVKEAPPHKSVVNPKLSAEGSPQHSTSQGDETIPESPNVSLTPLDRTFTSDGPTVKGILSLSAENGDEGKSKVVKSSHELSSHEVLKTGKQDLKFKGSEISQPRNTNNISGDSIKTLHDEKCLPKNSSCGQVNDTISNDGKKHLEGPSIQTKLITDSKNSMASLNDLPPLGALQGKTNFTSANSINFAGLGLQDEYEEDFHSTDSSAALEESSKNNSLSFKANNKPRVQKKETVSLEKLPKSNLEKETSDKATNSPVGSISEDIDDDTNSGIDDLLNSTASTEHTVDNSISHVRDNFADYIENI